MTVLSIIQNAADRISLTDSQVSSVIGSSNKTVRALYQAFLEEGADLLTEDPPWAEMITEYTFDTVAGQENYPFPPQFDRILNNTVWDRNQFWQVRGGLTPQQWQMIRSGLYQTARLSSNFRIKRAPDGIGKEFFLDPVPESVRTLVYEAVFKGWITDGGNTYETPQDDTNEVIFDDELMTLGVVWRYKQERSLPYQTNLVKYAERRNKLIAQNKSPTILTLNEQRWYLPIGNVPDTGYGSM